MAEECLVIVKEFSMQTGRRAMETSSFISDCVSEKSSRFGTLWHCPREFCISPVIVIIPLYCNCFLFISLTKEDSKLLAYCLEANRSFKIIYQIYERHTGPWISAIQNENHSDFQVTISHQEPLEHMERLPITAPGIVIRDLPEKVTLSGIFERKRKKAGKTLQSEKKTCNCGEWMNKSLQPAYLSGWLQ